MRGASKVVSLLVLDFLQAEKSPLVHCFGELVLIVLSDHQVQLSPKHKVEVVRTVSLVVKLFILVDCYEFNVSHKLHSALY